MRRHTLLLLLCGFSTSIVGSQIGPEDQRRKLEVVVETARAVWPS